MRTTTRSRFAIGTAALCTAAGLRYPADAAEFTYKLGHDDPAAYPPSVAIADAARKIKEDSGGRLEIQVYPDAILGGGSNMVTQLRSGALEFLREIYGVVAQVVPACALDALPYVYENQQMAWKARDGALGGFIRDEIAKIGIYTFEKSWDFGFRQVFNSVRPINTPDDFKGMKLRVPVDQTEVAFFKAMGASPTPLNINEMYTSLQTHVLDGGELPLGPILSRKLSEVCKYLSITNHISTGLPLMANGDAWRRLPGTLQEICQRNFNAAAVASRLDMAKNDSALENTLRNAGMAVNHADVGAFRGAVRRTGLYAQWRDQFGARAWGFLEQSVGKLA